MASLGHIAVGMAAARIHADGVRSRWPAMAWWSALSLLPDADVIGFALGVRYADPWGHRGATHSLIFAAVVAAALGLAARGVSLRPLRTWVVATVVLSSHALLDTLTTGGLGCALFWPFDLTRYFAPWRPIPVAPIGLAFLSPYGLFVASVEIILFAPLFLYGLRSARLRPALVAIWLGAVWLMASPDPIRNALAGTLLRERTEYARGFSEEAFRAIAPGALEADVRQRLGAPFGEYWEYDFESDCPFVYLESDAVVVLARDVGRATRMCAERGITGGMARADVERLLGPPREVCLRYSRGEAMRFHRARFVCLSGGRVVARIAEWQPG